MKSTTEIFVSKFRRGDWLALTVAAMLGVALWGGPSASANHPVYLEGNCNPFQPFVAAGTCGDYDGDGRVGTAEDSDSANDRIFGTINGALGAFALGNAADGSGPLNPSTAGMNGRIIIVSTGRFAETVTIGGSFPNPGNVEIEAARGVEANIDAVVQGDAGNTNRQNAVGITIDMPANRIVTLRNLTIRNFRDGVRIVNASRVNVDNCNIDNNRDFGIIAQNNSRLTMSNTRVVGTGFRVNPAVVNTPTPGDGLRLEDTTQAWLYDSTFFHNARAGISKDAAPVINASVDVVLGNNGGGDTTLTIATAPDSGGVSVSDEP